jgi:hypothetical protein
MEETTRPLYELTLKTEEDGVFAISLVENPAIEIGWVAFGNEVRFKSVNEEKRMLMGPLLIPDKKILRIDGSGKEYDVFISKDTISKVAQLYLQNGKQKEATIEHSAKIKGVTLVESWVTESQTKDKSAIYGFSMPVGTWMGVMKIDDDKLWEEYIKTGSIKGFSIEGIFDHTPVMASAEEDMSAEEVIQKIKELLNIR